MKPKKTDVKLTWEKEKIDKYNERHEATLNNIYTATVLLAQIYGRLGFQIKIQEKILKALEKK